MHTAPEDDTQPGDDLPGSADLDLDLLRRRINRVADPWAAPADADDTRLREDALEGLDTAWVLLFHVGSDAEGVYTVQDDDARTFVLAFEAEEDAARFARQLAAEDFDLPSVADWPLDIIEELCDEGGFRLSLVPQGVMLMPPRQNFYREDAPDALPDALELPEAVDADELLEALLRRCAEEGGAPVVEALRAWENRPVGGDDARAQALERALALAARHPLDEEGERE